MEKHHGGPLAGFGGELFRVRMARPMLHLLDSRSCATGLTITDTTQDTHAETMEVAQVHSFVASARALYWRMQELSAGGQVAGLQGWLRGKKNEDALVSWSEQ